MDKRAVPTNTFAITWKGYQVVYIPVSDRIVLPETNRSISLNRRGIDSFPVNKESGFLPVCLTVFLSNRCNLNCTYCYAIGKEKSEMLRLEPQIILDAAHLVAEQCVTQGHPFILGFHGGNDPLQYPAQIEEIIRIVQPVTDAIGIPLHCFCTTNGVISEKTARWAARTFRGITLSWDGPDDVHNEYRIRYNGKGTSGQVRQTAAIFRNSEFGLKFFKIRATVTQKSVERFDELVRFFKDQSIRSVDFFPVYSDIEGHMDTGLAPDKMKFIQGFLKARQWGRKYGMQIVYAGARQGDFHDRFCYLFQKNLAVTPDGFLTACFEATHNLHSKNSRFIFGTLKDLQPNGQRIKALTKTLINSLSKAPNQCLACFNFFHCAKGCPVVCPLQDMDSNSQTVLDCRIEKYIGLANLIEAAGFTIDYDDLTELKNAMNTVKAI